MAKMSLKEKLAAARAGGAAQPVDDASPPVEAEEAVSAPVEETEAPAPAPAAVAAAAAAASLGRPMTLKEKLAAARAGGTPASAVVAPAPKPVAAAKSVEASEVSTEKVVPPPAAALGRPMTLKEKLAAARGTGTSAPATGSGSAPVASAAKPVTAAKAITARVLPPLDKITDPKDLAEALRQAGAKKTKDVTAAAAAAKAAEAGATPAAAKAAGKATAKADPKAKPVAPKPSKSAATSENGVERRTILMIPIIGWIVIGWATFSAAMLQLTIMCGRFMFPNVLAEKPSTIKVGVGSQFEPNEVNERWKAEWGFWIVRSTYEGQDQIYAIQSVCTHLGCPPNWLAGEQKFKCPCHGSGFYISGINFEGPAPRPLERFKISTSDDGQLVVDKSQKFQQELGQWSDPDSFIPV